VLGSVLGPTPSRDGARLPPRDRRRGAAQLKKTGRHRPDLAIACVGGGSNAIGLFTAFLGDRGCG
jgi:tryptophan synthase beta subunit